MISRDPSGFYRLYSDSEEKLIEKTILFYNNMESEQARYLYIDPSLSEESRVDKKTLSSLFANGLLITIPDGLENGMMLIPVLSLPIDDCLMVCAVITSTITVTEGEKEVLVPIRFFSKEYAPLS